MGTTQDQVKTLTLVTSTKICSRCRVAKSLEAFSKDAKSKDHTRRHCRDCNAETARLKHVRYASNGQCTQCRQPYEGQGLCCHECLDKARRRYRDRDPESCLSCHRVGGLITTLLCEPCWLKEVSKRFLGSKKHWSELKDLIIKQGNRCALSGVPIRMGLNASVDHIIPKSLGGGSVMLNFRWVHTRVNQLRGNLSDAELLDLCSRVTTTLGSQGLIGKGESTWIDTYKNGIH